jgi:hypothetical protein
MQFVSWQGIEIFAESVLLRLSPGSLIFFNMVCSRESRKYSIADLYTGKKMKIYVKGQLLIETKGIM